ncbi:MAG: DUF2683 family protein [Nanoarchaeota archaeon]|nr:DUF2683 family protein [Nanoarchaeota archaeon]
MEKFISKSDLVGLRNEKMVQALVTLDDNENRVLNVVKAKYNLKDKSEAVRFVIQRYVEVEDEPALRPDFIVKMKRIAKQKSIRVDDFAARYGSK